jgi:aerobic carbon-monoxide dehydrogenase medium subunit
MPHIAHVQVRNRGTIGGSLSHADPAAELPAVMLACDAMFVATSSTGERTIAADRFFQGIFTTALEPGEILTEIRLPPWPRGRRFGFYEVTRRHGDFALAGAAVWIDGSDTTCAAARIVLFGVGDKPVRAERAERHLAGQAATPARVREAAAIAATELAPGSDIHASAEYRREVGAVVVRRALEHALGRGDGAHA